MSTTESDWSHFTAEILAELGWEPVTGERIAPGTGERESWADLVIPSRLAAAVRELNPLVPSVYLDEAVAAVVEVKSNDAITENQRVHDWLVGGFRGITYIDAEGQERTPTIELVSADPDRNHWIVATEVTIRRAEHHRRFDLVLYCNGLPVSIIELKKAGRGDAGPAEAHAQLVTYLEEFPTAFRFAVFDLASDGIDARYGTPFTPFHHWSPWNVDDDGGEVGADAVDALGDTMLPLETALYGLYNQDRFLQLLRSFTAFDGGEAPAKRIAKPHQYFAVTKAVANTIHAVESDGKAGVVWHTQGSGKSMEMELYAARIMRHPKMLNPTIVVITDRKELDGQLYDAFQRSRLLPEQPVKITTRSQLRRELSERVTGGIYFTTLQKFGRSVAERGAGEEHPLLSDRRNIVVVVDEAHRSHYDDLDGYARHLKDALPRATLIAFTGTPISFEDRNTRAVFGDYIDIYDLTRAVTDGATVPVYFEPRLIKVALAAGVTEEDLDRAADDATGALDDVERARVEGSVAQVNAVYGAPARMAALAADLVAHWESRRALMMPMIEAPGKAMIVGATREICVRLYDTIVALRPEWHSDDPTTGAIKVVFSGTPSDPAHLRAHVRRDSENKMIKERVRNVDDELELVIVKDMMLTGFDAPPLHTLYLDRPLKGALLMQTLARVNRTFRGKDAGLLVGYAPLADNLQRALQEYSPRDQQERPIGQNVEEAAALAITLIGEIREMLKGVEWRSRIVGGKPMSFAKTAQLVTNHLRDPQTAGNQVVEGEDRLSDRYRSRSRALMSAWALASGSEALQKLRAEVQFYEEVRVYMAKYDAAAARAEGRPVPEEIERLLRALIADSTETGEIIDIYRAAGLEKPALSDLTPDYTDKAKRARNPHLAIEALRKTVLEESRSATRTNTIRQRAFSERVAELMLRYTNQQLTAAEVIAAMVELAKEVAAEANRGKKFDPPLSQDELSFYDAVAENESAVTDLGGDVLARIARELVAVMRRDVRTDWTVRDDVRAKLRSSIKRLLVKYDYPPDKQPGATRLVLEQMELMAGRYVGEQG